MQREYLILMQGEKSLGAVKIEPEGNCISADVTVDSEYVLKENCVFKAYITLPAKGETSYLGVLEDHWGKFILKNTVAPIGIVITVKNTQTTAEELCCLCAEEGKLNEVRQCFEGLKKPEETAVIKKEHALEFEKEYLKTAEEKLMSMFEDYSFEKVNGYFLRTNHRIAEYIMSGGEVYRNIMQAGYYYFADRTTNTAKEFIIAIPAIQGSENPFISCLEYSFEICSDSHPQEKYFCVAAGCDDEGEYFCRKK